MTVSPTATDRVTTLQICCAVVAAMRQRAGAAASVDCAGACVPAGAASDRAFRRRYVFKQATGQGACPPAPPHSPRLDYCVCNHMCVNFIVVSQARTQKSANTQLAINSRLDAAVRLPRCVDVNHVLTCACALRVA